MELGVAGITMGLLTLPGMGDTVEVTTAPAGRSSEIRGSSEGSPSMLGLVSSTSPPFEGFLDNALRSSS